MSITLMIVLAALNVPLFILLGRSWFGGWEEFLESLVAFFIRSDLSAAMSGNYHEHRIGRLSLLGFVIVCIGTWAAEYHVVATFIFRIEHPWS